MELTLITKKIINKIDEIVHYERYLNIDHILKSIFLLAGAVSVKVNPVLIAFFFWLYIVIKLLAYKHGKIDHYEIKHVTALTFRKRIINKIIGKDEEKLKVNEIIELQYKRTSLFFWLIPFATFIIFLKSFAQ